MSKGLELPINTVIILVLGLIIMVAVVGFYVGTWTPTQSATEVQNNFRTECLAFNNKGCCVTGTALTGVCAISAELRSAATAIGITTDEEIRNQCCTKRP